MGSPKPAMSARSGGGAGVGLPSLTVGGGGGRGSPLRGDGRGGIHSASRHPAHTGYGYARGTTHVYPFRRVQYAGTEGESRIFRDKKTAVILNSGSGIRLNG